MSEDCVDYLLTDGRMMRLNTSVAASVNMLEITAGESFFVCKRWNGDRKQPPRWDVWLTPESEKARAAVEAPGIEQQLRESLAFVGGTRASAVVAENKIADLKRRELWSGSRFAQAVLEEKVSRASADIPFAPPQPAAVLTQQLPDEPEPKASCVRAGGKPASIPQRVPLNVAATELLAIATNSLKSAGLTCGPSEIQRVWVTLLIQAGEMHMLGPWERT
jgi:hypothetical protein